MRFWLSLLFLAPALLAQQNYWHFEIPPAPERFPLPQTQPVTRQPPGKTAFKPLPMRTKAFRASTSVRTCSIPLINGLKSNQPFPDRMAIAPTLGRLKGDLVPPPAPPCDDVKR